MMMILVLLHTVILQHVSKGWLSLLGDNRRRHFPFRKPPGSPITMNVTNFSVRHPYYYIYGVITYDEYEMRYLLRKTRVYI